MSKYVVSARKYRPMRFEEVVGQNHVSNTLKNALKTDHLGHSFLFCGPRGVGKTTSARILAKVLNCENRTQDFEPCNTCSSCTAFNQNQSFNIYELDAASNNSVENIRDLVDQVRFPPQQGSYKVYIIDEVHMLSQAAFNAFLKTLEEPPSYAIFILATTEKHKILPTILSRCQIFDFNRVQVKDIVSHLLHICLEEGIVAEEAALHIIAQKADGALRDALSIFDRIISLSGQQLTTKDVNEGLNLLDVDTYFELTNYLLLQDKNSTLLLFDNILKHGFEGDQLMLGLGEHFRNLLVVKEPKTRELLEVSQDVISQYIKQSELSSTSFLMNALTIANQCDLQFKQSKNKRLHVELALLKMCYLSTIQSNISLPQDDLVLEKKKVKALQESLDTKQNSSDLDHDKPQTKTEQEIIPQKNNTSEVEAQGQIVLGEAKPIELVDQPNEIQSNIELEVANQNQEESTNTVEEIHKPIVDVEPQEEVVSNQAVDKKLASKIEPALSFRISQLSKAVAQKKQREQEQENIPVKANDLPNPEVSQEKMEEAWFSIGEKIQSISLTKGIMDSKIQFQNDHLQVTVFGKVIKDYLKEHHNLIITTIQEQTGLHRFTYDIECVEIDKGNVKTYTKEEELAYIQEKNPAIKKLCDDLNLEIRYD